MEVDALNSYRAAEESRIIAANLYLPYTSTGYLKSYFVLLDPKTL